MPNIRWWIPTLVIATALVAGCKRDAAPAAAGADPAGARPTTDQAAASKVPGDARDGKADRPDSGLPPTPAQYTRAVDTVVSGVQFATSGDETKNAIGNITKTFASKDSVFVEVATQGTAADYQISTRWIAPDKTVLLENGRTVADAGPSRTVFSLSKPDGWKPGTYHVEVLLNGKPSGQYPFDVH